MKLSDLIDFFEKVAPSSLQESYDNSGLQIGDPNKDLKKGLICLDATPAVIEEAIEQGCDLIITHHPLIFGGLNKITGSTQTERVIIEAIKNNIAIYSIHTNLDNVSSGINGILGEKLGLSDLKILKPVSGLLRKLVTFCPISEADAVRDAIFEAGAGQIGEYDCCSFNVEGKGSFRGGEESTPFVGEKGKVHFEPEVRIETILPAYLVAGVVDAMISAHPYEEVAYDVYPLENKFEKVGAGMIGTLKIPLSECDFLNLLKAKLKTPSLRHTKLTGRVVKKVAFCGGAGSFLLNEAFAKKADAFVTSEVKHNQFIDAQSRLLLVDAGHYETEQFALELLYDVVSKNFSNFAISISRVHLNPVNYF